MSNVPSSRRTTSATSRRHQQKMLNFEGGASRLVLVEYEGFGTLSEADERMITKCVLIFSEQITGVKEWTFPEDPRVPLHLQGVSFEVGVRWNLGSRFPDLVLLERLPEPVVNRPKVPAPSSDCVDVTLGLVGRENSGKTLFLNSLMTRLPRKPLPSKLHFGFDASEVADALNIEAKVHRTVQNGILGATASAEDGKFTLYQGVKPRVNFRFREVVGQALLSQNEWQSELEEYQKHLTECDVIWVIIPTPPSDLDKSEWARFEKDLMLTKSFLMSALGNRTNPKPCSVALVMTKLDTHFQTAEMAHRELTDEILKEKMDLLVAMLNDVEEVWNAAIFPVSAFGFSNAIELSTRLGDDSKNASGSRGNDDGVNLHVAGERLYQLKPDAVMEPFNAEPLVLWSLVVALLHQQVDGAVQETDNSLMAVWELLLKDLDRVPSLSSLIKTRLPQGNH